MVETVHDFLKGLELEGKSKATIEAYRIDLYGFAGSFDQKETKEVSVADIREYLRRLQEEGLSTASINRNISSLRAYFRYLEENGLIEENPMLKVKGIKLQRNRAPECLPAKEMDLLLDQPRLDKPQGVRDFAILTVLLNTGLRVSELCELDLADVEINPRSGQIEVKEKGNRIRWVPLNLTTRKVLIEYLKQRPEVDTLAFFVSRKHRRFTSTAIEYMVRKYLTNPGTEGETPAHGLGHLSHATLKYKG